MQLRELVQRRSVLFLFQTNFVNWQCNETETPLRVKCKQLSQSVICPTLGTLIFYDLFNSLNVTSLL